MISMLFRLAKYFRLIQGFSTLASLLLISSLFYRNVGDVHASTDPNDDKDKITSQSLKDQNQFLFVDCTGFFE